MGGGVGGGLEPGENIPFGGELIIVTGKQYCLLVRRGKKIKQRQGSRSAVTCVSNIGYNITSKLLDSRGFNNYFSSASPSAQGKTS